ncbi:hypothetical protein FOPE_10919 [Fonsecaea pedrosoi]|nr:hypothetical protein FOPE_10919 [Fonsecaea pedrosoi]
MESSARCISLRAESFRNFLKSLHTQKTLPSRSEMKKVAYRQIGNHARIAQWIPDDADEYIDLVFYPNGNMTDYLDRYKDEIPRHLVVR